MNLLHRVLLALVCALPVLSTQAQGWPDRPVRIVIPFPPGGGADAAARLIAGQLTKELGQTFLVDARPGGNTTIAASAVARAPADGYTEGKGQVPLQFGCRRALRPVHRLSRAGAGQTWV